MPYKQKSPFGNFRNPNRTKNNYNPVDFKMPDLSPIYNKTADGSTIVEESDKEGANQNGVHDNPLINEINKKRGEASTPNAIKNEAQKRKLEVKAEEKAFKQKLKDARQAKNLRAKYQTAEEKKQATEAFNTIKDEAKFRREAKFKRTNKEDLRNAVMGPPAPQPPTVKKEKPLSQNMLNQAHNVRLMDKQGKQGAFSHMVYKSEKENIPMDRMKITDVGIVTKGGADKAPFKKPTKNKVANLYTQQEQDDDLNEMNNLMDDRKFNAINNPLGRGTRVDKASSMGPFQMVSRKGSAFPMVSDSPLNFNNQNRNPNAGTGTGTSTNTGAGTGTSTSAGTGTTTNTNTGTAVGTGTGTNAGADNFILTTNTGTAVGTGTGNNTAVGTGTSTGGPGGGSGGGTAAGMPNTGTGASTGTGTSTGTGSGSGSNAGVKTGGGATGGAGVGGINGSTGVLLNTNTTNTVGEIDQIAQLAGDETNLSYTGKGNDYSDPNSSGSVNPFDASNLAATPNGDRAGKGENTGKLTNNVLPGLSAGSVPARGIQRDMQFNNKAMSSGELYAPPQPTGMNANTDSSFNTPQAKTFDDDSAVGMYATSRSSFPKIDFKSLKKGALRKELNVPEGEKIPLNKLEIKPGDSETTKKRKNLAKTMRKF